MLAQHGRGEFVAMRGRTSHERHDKWIVPVCFRIHVFCLRRDRLIRQRRQRVATLERSAPRLPGVIELHAPDAGVHAKVVAERLGHSRTQVTLDTYSHVAAGLQREAVDVLDRLFACADEVYEASGERLAVEDAAEPAQ
jgi:hypothetical protein